VPVNFPQGVWTAQNVMDFLNISRSTLYRWTKAGYITAYKRTYNMNAHNCYDPEEIKNLVKIVEKSSKDLGMQD